MYVTNIEEIIAWKSTPQNMGEHMIIVDKNKPAVLQLHRKHAAAKSSYGPQNAARERGNAWMGLAIFWGIKMQWEIRDLALNEQGLSFTDFFLCFFSRDSNKLTVSFALMGG